MGLRDAALRWVARKLPVFRVAAPDGAPYLDRHYILGDRGALVDFPGAKARLGGLPFALYLHKFHSADWHPTALHDHPADALAIGLVGGYVEHRRTRTPAVRAAGSVCWHRAEDFHRVAKLLGSPTWTLFAVGRKRREWSFYDPRDGRTYPWLEFLLRCEHES